MQKCSKVGAECCPVFWQTFYVPQHVQGRLVRLHTICSEKLLCCAFGTCSNNTVHYLLVYFLHNYVLCSILLYPI